MQMYGTETFYWLSILPLARWKKNMVCRQLALSTAIELAMLISGLTYEKNPLNEDCNELWSSTERTRQRADVLNGISVAEDPDLLYLTGKYWDRMFLVR